MSAKWQNYEDKFKLCPSISNFPYKESFQTSSTYSWILFVNYKCSNVVEHIFKVIFWSISKNTKHSLWHSSKSTLMVILWSVRIRTGCFLNIWHFCGKIILSILKMTHHMANDQFGFNTNNLYEPNLSPLHGLYYDLWIFNISEYFVYCICSRQIPSYISLVSFSDCWCCLCLYRPTSIHLTCASQQRSKKCYISESCKMSGKQGICPIKISGCPGYKIWVRGVCFLKKGQYYPVIVIF